MLDPSILTTATQVPLVSGTVGATDPLQQAALQVQQAQSHARTLAATIQIQSEVDTHSELKTAASKAARMLARVTQASIVQIAWRESESAACELIADSAQASLESSPELLAACEEIALRGELTQYPCDQHSGRHALLAVANYVKTISHTTQTGTRLIGTPLIDARGLSRGALIAINPTDQSAKQQLDTIGPVLATKLGTLHAMQPRLWERLVRALTDRANHSRRKVFLVATAAFAVAMLLPVPYQVAAVCELQPTKRRIIAAPFDGPLETVLVRPGDIVNEGDTLARINPREIDYELAGLRAELRRSVQEEKGMMVKQDFGAGKIAALETERLQLESDLLAYQRKNLEIRSPLSGIVVTGDLKQSEGTPLSKGETMFEIAPLGDMIVEIAIPEADIQQVRPSMIVQFYLHAVPDQQLTGSLRNVHPRAELRDHDNVFIGEVAIHDSDGILRPGMRGRAWIVSERHTLAWNLFHKAYYSLRTAVGW